MGKSSAVDSFELNIFLHNTNEKRHLLNRSNMKSIEYLSQLISIKLLFLCLILTASIFAQSKSFVHGNKRIISVRFTNENEKFISADESGLIKFWDIQSSNLLWSIKFEIPKRMGDFTSIKIHSLEISPDEKYAAVAYIRSGVDRNIVDEKLGDTMKQRDVVYEPHIVFINLEAGKIEKDISDKDKVFEDVVFSEDGKALFIRTEFLDVSSPTTYYDYLGKLDIKSEKMSEIIRFDKTSNNLVFTPNKNIFAVTDYNSSSKMELVKLFDVSKKNLIFNIEHNFKQKPSITFSPDNKYIVLAGQSQTGIGAEIWDIEKKVKVNEFSKKYKMVITGVLFSASNRLILSGRKFKYQGNIPIREMIIKDKGGRIYVFASDSVKPVKYKFKSSVMCIDYSPNKSQLAVGLFNGKVEILNIK